MSLLSAYNLDAYHINSGEVKQLQARGVQIIFLQMSILRLCQISRQRCLYLCARIISRMGLRIQGRRLEQDTML